MVLFFLGVFADVGPFSFIDYGKMTPEEHIGMTGKIDGVMTFDKNSYEY
jgi:hypothetical protein